MSATTDATPFGAVMGEVARELLGDPNKSLSTRHELRFGTRGSLSIDLEKGTFFNHETGQGGGVIDLVKQRLETDKAGAVAWLETRHHLPAEAPVKPRQVATYDYCDEAGQVLYQVVRFEPKDFRQRQPNGRGGWRWKMEGVQRVLYRLPAVLEAARTGRTVYVAEGEKAVHALESIGLTATCSPGGAGKWRKVCSDPLKGADVVILPDNDEPGQAHAADVAAALQGIARRVRVLMLPDLPPKGDVADWIAAGGTADALKALADGAADVGQEAPPDAAPEEESDWTQWLQRDESGSPLNNLANAMTALRSAPELRQCFAYDQMQRATMVVQPVPRGSADDLPRLARDVDLSMVQEWLQRHDLRRISRDTVQQAVALYAEERSFHPVRDYLHGLHWDGKKRLDTWLSYYLGVADSAYARAIGRMFFVAMVARVMQPGCKADYMLVLEGSQGVRKSTACSILGGRWFSDSLPHINGIDGVRLAQHIRGKWLIEIAELASMGKSEAEDLKAFITKQEEKFTPKYGRLEVEEPRQCLFVGTTNKASYLRDETGARRFWPVQVTSIDTDALAVDRDQLFAEAVAAFRAGEQWWPNADFERDHIRPQQDARYEADAWEQAIREWSADKPINARITILEVARHALGIETQKLGTADQRRISAALERLGWHCRRSNGVRHWTRNHAE